MAANRSTYLSRYFDSGLKLPKIGASEDLQDRQIERISRALSVVVLAGTIPRRIGGEASSEDLAMDKKRAKRAGHALSQSLRQWRKREGKLPIDDSIRREAAQLLWPRWSEEHMSTLRSELAIVSTWAILVEQEAWGKQAVVRLDNELTWILYSMR